MKPLYTKEEAQTIINEYKNLELENQILKHEEFPINVNLEQKLNFIFKFRKDYPIEILCKVLDVNRSTYYKHFYNELQQEKE